MTTVFKSSSKTFVTTLLIAVGGFISSVITARALGPDGRGLLSAALLIGTLAATFAQMGLSSSFVYYLGAARPFNYYRMYWASLIAVSLLAALSAVAGIQFSHDASIHQHWILIATYALFMSSYTYFSSIGQVQSDLNYMNFMRMAMVAGNLVFVVFLVLLYKSVDYQSILITQTFTVIALTVSGIYWADKHAIWHLRAISKASVSMGKVLHYALNQHGTVLLGVALLNFDKVVLLNMGTIAQYGYYAVAFSTSRLIGSIQDAISLSLFSHFAGKDLKLLGDKVRIAFRLTFVPMLLLAAIGAALSPWLIVWVYGKPFAPMAAPFAILLFEAVIGGGSWILAQHFNAGGKPGAVLFRQVISMLPVFALVPFIPQNHAYVDLALLMLVAATVRLIVTLFMYPITLKEPMPRILPTWHDISLVKQTFTRQ